MRLLFFLFMVVTVSSCSVEKRHYRTGWYIDKPGKANAATASSPKLISEEVELAEQRICPEDSLSKASADPMVLSALDSAKQEVPNGYSVVRKLKSSDRMIPGLSLQRWPKDRHFPGSDSGAVIDQVDEELMREQANLSMFLIILAYLSVVAMIIMMVLELTPVYIIMVGIMSLIAAIASTAMSFRLMKIYRQAENKKMRGRNVTELALAFGITYLVFLVAPLVLLVILWLAYAGY